METKTLSISDGLTLTYYRAGVAEDSIVIANAPGMSIEFWASVIRELERDYTVLAFDYRGFPDPQSELRVFTFDDFVGDLSIILNHENVGAAHFVSWDSGAKVAFEFQRKFPEQVLSFVHVAPDDAAVEAEAVSRLTSAVLDVKKRIDAHPESVNAVTKVIKRIGCPASVNLFLSLLRDENLTPVLNLIDLFETESSLSNLAFRRIETPVGLKNYLRILEEFDRFKVVTDFKNIRVPAVFVEGGSDGITRLGARARRDLEAIPRLERKTIKGASHFAPIELPRKVANIIKDATRRTDALRAPMSHTTSDGRRG